ncbi:hypothetical protein T10_8043, partial [Trichinella papuae]
LSVGDERAPARSAVFDNATNSGRYMGAAVLRRRIHAELLALQKKGRVARSSRISQLDTFTELRPVRQLAILLGSDTYPRDWCGGASLRDYELAQRGEAHDTQVLHLSMLISQICPAENGGSDRWPEVVPQMTTTRVLQILWLFIARPRRPVVIQWVNIWSLKAVASELRPLWWPVEVHPVEKPLPAFCEELSVGDERAPARSAVFDNATNSGRYMGAAVLRRRIHAELLALQKKGRVARSSRISQLDTFTELRPVRQLAILLGSDTYPRDWCGGASLRDYELAQRGEAHDTQVLHLSMLISQICPAENGGSDRWPEVVPQMTTTRVLQILWLFIARPRRPVVIQWVNIWSLKAVASELRPLWWPVEVHPVEKPLEPLWKALLHEEWLMTLLFDAGCQES